ncbi:MAG: 50S ribosomal protein L9 [Candidatus Dadabacteria bacterium]|nr:50S ribosomal protein L9 [Candidatus Dadabacteria bacterium]MYC39423.1 50S ribosomal protein L9 [Candidatus Dadabacteria bacterium]
MKVILISDVENIGSVGDVKDVKNGMARNYLFPRKLAIKATEANLKAWESRIEAIRLRKTEIIENAKALAEKLKGLEISISAKSGEENRLFGSVTSQNISDALAEKGFEISRRDIALDGTIKALGTYTVALKLHTDVTQQITLNVVKEEEQ